MIDLPHKLDPCHTCFWWDDEGVNVVADNTQRPCRRYPKSQSSIKHRAVGDGCGEHSTYMVDRPALGRKRRWWQRKPENTT